MAKPKKKLTPITPAPKPQIRKAAEIIQQAKMMMEVKETKK